VFLNIISHSLFLSPGLLKTPHIHSLINGREKSLFLDEGLALFSLLMSLIYLTTMKVTHHGFLAVLLSTLLVIADADSTFNPARPPAIPLAVKSPYFNTWQFAGSDGGNGGYLAGQWPQFWE
jgi:hypothetical protein